MDRLIDRSKDAEDRVRAALDSIGVSARANNLARAERIDEALSSLEAGGLTGEQRELALRSAHQLAGSAGTFGLQPASRIATWFERFFTTIEIGESGGGTNPELTAAKGDLGAARLQLAELRTRLDDPPDLD